MKKPVKIIPEGTRDLIFEDCSVKRNIENKVKDVFEKRGYNEVITPSLEYLDVINIGGTFLPNEQMYKLFDNKNRILVLRPDNTMPISRVVTTRLKDEELPIRLYYNQNIFRTNDYLNGKRDEITQSGVELIGKTGLKADIEIISTAIEVLKKCCNEDFKIEINNVCFFNALIKEADIEEEDFEKIHNLIELKNFTAVETILTKYGDRAKSLRILPRLFGSDEIFDMAKEITGNALALSSLDYLHMLYSKLCDLGYKEYILIDLGLVHHIDYYTGIIFRGYVSGSGQTVLSGGRYDDLLEKYGLRLPATGFAVNIDALSDILKSKSNTIRKSSDVMIFYNEGYIKKAYEYAEKLNDEGITTEFCLEDTIKKAKNVALKKNIKAIVVIGENIDTIDTIGGEIE